MLAGNPPMWKVTHSGLSNEEKALLDRLRKSCGGKVQLCSKWMPKVTHLIAACTPDGLAKRTLKCALHLEPSLSLTPS